MSYICHDSDSGELWASSRNLGGLPLRVSRRQRCVHTGIPDGMYGNGKSIYRD